jgi:serine/threonine protein kinase
MSHDAFEAPGLDFLAERLPQYAFEGFIAQGGMGAVYKARQISLERDVAIKVLPLALSEDPGFRECFTKEAKAMARLNHPNLIGVFDSGDVDGMLYIVMEFIEGSSLHESAWGQVVDAAQAATIVKGICDGLAHAHEHGIIHRDIKPANILLTTKAEPKIGDFGLAHTLGSDQTGIVMGTPGYTAPEVFEDPDKAGPLADIYSVGVILHQLITGIDPAGSEGPPNQASGQLILDGIWRKATRANPAMRYQSVAEMGAELQKWLTQRSRARRSTPAAAGFSPTMRGRGVPPAIARGEADGGGIALKLAAVVLVGVAIWVIVSLVGEKDVVVEKKGVATDTGKVPSLLDSLPKANPVGELPPLASGDGVSTPDPDPMPPEMDPLEVAAQAEPKTEPDVDDPEPEPDKTVPVEKPEPGVVADLPPGDPELQNRATSLILEARKKRDALLVQNASPLKSFLKDRARSAEQEEAKLLGQLADACETGRLPDPEILPELAPSVDTVYQRAHGEQKTIESAHQTELVRIRDFYVPKLRKAAEETFDAQLRERLIDQAESASDVAAWVAKLAPEPEREAVVFRPANRGFVGRWVVSVDDVTQWIADENGLVTINDGPWKGKTANWKQMPDGTVEVHWPDKPRPYTLSSDGNGGWTGKTSFGKPVTIVPGNW